MAREGASSVPLAGRLWRSPAAQRRAAPVSGDDREPGPAPPPPWLARTTDVVTAVDRLGGTCTWRELRRAVPWRLIGATVEAGLLVHPGRGIYALPAPTPVGSWRRA